MTQLMPIVDLAEIAWWFVLLFVTGLAALPLARHICPGSHDRGYLAAKVLGWLIMSWVPWLLASFGLISFKDSGPVIGFLVLAAIFGLLRRDWAWPGWRRLLAFEAMFAALFVAGLFVRLGLPDLSTLEKFTNLGFMTTAMRTDAMPPVDMWLAGSTINYYYLGHVGAALWASLAGVAPDHAYQLHMATLFALTGIGIYRLTSELAGQVPAVARAVAGGTAALLVLFAGNLHSVLYTLFRPWMGSTLETFVPSASTRFVGYDPVTSDKTITEFAAYSFHVGDMHGHVLATPAFLLALSLLWSVLKDDRGTSGHNWLRLAVLGWVGGLCYATNAFDVAILGLMAGFVWLALLLEDLRARAPDRLDGHVAGGLFTLLCGFAGVAPFIADFSPFANGVVLSDVRTPFWQLMVLYGHFSLPLIILVALLALWRPASPQLVFIALLAALVVALIAIPEIVYVDDIYREEFRRANTMFKLSYRAQMLIFVISAWVVLTLAMRGTHVRRIIAAVTAVPVLATFIYVADTVRPIPEGGLKLDGLGFLGEERAMIEAVARLPLDHGEAILEASGPSFSQFARVSTVTGKPTVLGWFEHQWLWRNGPEIPNRRRADVDQLYRSTDPLTVCRLLEMHNVRYIVLAEREREANSESDFKVLRDIGEPVFEDEGMAVFEVRQDRCRQWLSLVPSSAVGGGT